MGQSSASACWARDSHEEKDAKPSQPSSSKSDLEKKEHLEKKEGSAASGCCWSRDSKRRPGFHRPNSYIGDDIFFDVEEENPKVLLVQKTSTFTRYSAHVVQQQMPCVVRSASNLLPSQASRGMEGPVEGDWLGKTARRWTSESLPAPEGGTCWSAGSGSGLELRDCRDARGRMQKAAATTSMYECISMDFVRAGCKIEDILGRLVRVPAQTSVGAGDQGGGSKLWTAACPLPRVICVNLMLPYQAGPKMWGEHPADDHGASFVATFQIRSETLRLLQSPDRPACVQLFEEFMQGPCGTPDSGKDDPNRSLGARRDDRMKQSDHPGLFKALAFADNLDDIKLPSFMHKFNGKPALVSKSGYVVKGGGGEWLELGVDFRKFCPLARDGLVRFRELIPKASLHFGFLIQGVAEDELPEGLLGDVHVHYLDLMHGPQLICDPRAGDTNSAVRKELEQHG